MATRTKFAFRGPRYRAIRRLQKELGRVLDFERKQDQINRDNPAKADALLFDDALREAADAINQRCEGAIYQARWTLNDPMAQAPVEPPAPE